MGTIAEKLTYLNTTKEKIRDSINLTGANIGTSDTFRSYASKLKKGYIDIINNGIDTLYNNFPKVSGIGSNLSLTPTYEAPMKLNEIQGDTLQDGTPTPNTPVPIQSVTGLQNVEVCGKNLLNIPDGTYSNNGITAVSSNGIITLNGTATDTSFITITLLKEIVVANQTLTISNNNQENTSDNLTEVRLLTTVGNYIPCSFKQINNSTTRTNLTDTYNRLQIRTSSGVSFENFIIKPQLEKGSTATEYEPYKGNTYEVNLGKNLLKFPYTESTLTRDGITYTINNDGSIKISGTATSQSYIDLYRNTNVNLLEKGNTYTYSISPENSNIRLQFYERYNNAWNDKGYGTNKITFTISDNSEGQMIRLLVVNGSTIDTTISPQIEKGSQATSYSPYFTPIELNKIGTYKDRIYKDNGKWYIEKNIGKVVLNGSEGWGLASTYTNNTRFSSSSLILGKTTNLMSNYFVEGQGGTDTPNIDTNGTSGQLMITIPTSIASTLSQFITWLSTNKPEILYQLDTPTYTEITNTELIEDLETLYTAKSQEGTTNISITSEDLEMILNISALKGEV